MKYWYPSTNACYHTKKDNNLRTSILTGTSKVYKKLTLYSRWVGRALKNEHLAWPMLYLRPPAQGSNTYS